jgi:hypothetical protein
MALRAIFANGLTFALPDSQFCNDCRAKHKNESKRSDGRPACAESDVAEEIEKLEMDFPFTQKLEHAISFFFPSGWLFLQAGGPKRVSSDSTIGPILVPSDPLIMTISSGLIASIKGCSISAEISA